MNSGIQEFRNYKRTMPSMPQFPNSQSLNLQSSILNGQFSIFNFQSKGGCEEMALMRAFARVDKEVKISIPKNIQRETDLKEGQLVEIKVSGQNRAQFITIHKRQAAR